jgi:LysM repeat protein
MKKEVQALIKRRRARMVPAILAGLAVIFLVAGLLLVVNFFTQGPGQSLLRTPTPMPSATLTQPLPTPTLAASLTPRFTLTPTVTSGPSPTPSPITYTVNSGDTLFGIAQQFNVDLCELMAFNQVLDPVLVSVGTVITIPVEGVELPTPTPLPTGLPRGSRIRYVVQCGDSLQLIAAKFNSTAEDIAQRNRITDLNTIQPGQVLEVRINIATPTPTIQPTSTGAPAADTLTGTATP